MLRMLVIFKKNAIIFSENKEIVMVRLIILILIIAVGVWGYQKIDPSTFTKENVEEAIKKEKTINTVQQQREKRRQEAEDVMNKF